LCNAEAARPLAGEPENKTASVWREFMRTFSFHDELKKAPEPLQMPFMLFDIIKKKLANANPPD